MEGVSGTGRVAIKSRQARQRILDASSELFAKRGIRAVGVDELIERAKVAKATFYSHFHSKDELVLAYLERLHETRSASIDAAIHSQDRGPMSLLAVFDVFAKVVRPEVNDATSFVHVLIEMGPEHPLGRASAEYLTRIRQQIAALAREVGLRNPEGFARKVQILLEGAVIAAVEGDREGVEQARQLGALLIDLHRGAPPPAVE
jgi:AcrR family transcriptional regulator